MKLTDYAPRFGCTTNDDRLTHLHFRCPCSEQCDQEITVSFTPALDSSETPAAWKPWRRESGSTVEDLTLSPSINFYPAGACKGWHGFLRGGQLETCG
jgi:hypothetical protein